MSETNGNGSPVTIPFDEGACERYFFGELDGDELERFETSYFDDDAFFNRFMAVKDELLDLYARNELDADKRSRLERHFRATAPRRQHLEESNDFIRSVTVIADRLSPAVSAQPVVAGEASLFERVRDLFILPRLAAVSGLIITAIAIGFLISRPSDVSEMVAEPTSQQAPSFGSADPGPATPERSATDTNSITPEQTNKNGPFQQPAGPDEPDLAAKPLSQDAPNDTVTAPGTNSNPQVPQPAPTTPPESRVAVVPKPGEPMEPERQPEISGEVTESVTLASASRSITKNNTAKIGTATRSVLIRILFGGEAYSSYSVRVSTLGGQTVWRGSGLKTGINDGAKALAVTVPASSLSRKDYIVTLEGRSKDGSSETIREFYLHVDRQ